MENNVVERSAGNRNSKEIIKKSKTKSKNR